MTKREAKSEVYRRVANFIEDYTQQGDWDDGGTHSREDAFKIEDAAIELREELNRRSMKMSSPPAARRRRNQRHNQ